MTDYVTIDGVNTYTTYGAFVSRKGYREIVRWPSAKDVKANDWQEYDGSEPDLSSLTLGSIVASMNFVCKGGIGNTRAFWSFLAGKRTMSCTFNALGFTTTMRMLSMTSLDYALEFSNITIRFAIDQPFASYVYQARNASGHRDTGYYIDNIDLAEYGVSVIKGTFNDVAAMPDIKPLLTRDILKLNGVIYDENPLINDPDDTLPASDYDTIGGSFDGVSANWKRAKAVGTNKTASREVTLKCFMQASAESFWRNYLALLHDLTAANQSPSDITLTHARKLKINDLQNTYSCYYKGQDIEEIVCAGGIIWAKFNITLTLIQARTNEGIFLLAAETGALIITESTQVYIDLTPDN